ncbi:HlyD family secretion protein [Maridesulfovibrio zosterae]|uniref:HlyD family secretion protein n=1 Tax=Maridesulfovibrio zosterae TaxID=82171 RepID=UPI00041A58E0|nr:HlyD family secretion protein [Maridesulfovibrio zosterae]
MNKKSISQTDKSQKAKGLKGNLRVTILISTVIMLICIALVYPIYVHAISHESTDNAFVEAHVISISPRVPGHISKVLVIDNQQIEKGDVIAEIDPRDYQVALEVAQARIKSAQASVKEADALVVAAEQELAQKKAEFSSQTAGLSKIKADVAQAKAGYLRDENDLNRIQKIAKAGAVSIQEFDHAKAQEAMARANLNSVKFQINTQSAEIIKAQAAIEAAYGKVQQAYAQIEMRKAMLSEAEAEMEQAKLNLSYTKITAPYSGYITRKSIEPGNFVLAGQKILSIVGSDIWIVANFKETQIMPMRPGQHVDIEVDSYPDHTFTGHIDSIQRGTGSRFTLLPPENAAGNFIKVVQRVPVKIVLDNFNPSSGYLLAPGMSVIPSVDISQNKSESFKTASSGRQE